MQRYVQCLKLSVAQCRLPILQVSHWGNQTLNPRRYSLYPRLLDVRRLSPPRQQYVVDVGTLGGRQRRSVPPLIHD